MTVLPHARWQDVGMRGLQIRWARSPDPHATGRLLLRELIAAAGHPDVPITARCPDCDAAHGQPLAVGTGWHVSLSYSGDFVVAAACRVPVGVDVEALMQPEERLDAINKLTGIRSLVAWTRTEAVLKADGRGLRVDPLHVTFEGDTATLDGVSYDLREIEVEPQLLVSVATAVAP